MLAILSVGTGGFLGAISRFLISKNIDSTNFPFGTLTVNLVGSFILGLLVFSPFFDQWNTQWKNLITIGFLGSFTTMSSFNVDSFKLIENTDFLKFGLNIFLNVGIGLLFVWLGKTAWEVAK